MANLKNKRTLATNGWLIRDKRVLVLFILALLVLLKDSLALLPKDLNVSDKNHQFQACNDETLKLNSRLYILCGKPLPINSADQATLEMLPGIGPHLAGKIISYRIENGLYGCLEDLLPVKGIGEKTLAKLSGKLSFD